MRKPWLFVGLVAWAGCGVRPPPSSASASRSAWVPEAAPPYTTVIARVGQVPIFVAEVEAERARSGKGPRAALDDLVAFNLLAERARLDDGGAQLPAFQIPRELYVQRFLEREFEPTTRLNDVTDDELRQAYEKVKVKFVHPRLVEIALLSVYTGPTMRPEPRAAATETAHALADYVAKRPVHTAEDFAAIAADPAWSPRKVRYWRLWQGTDLPFGRKVAGPVQALHQLGQTTALMVDDSGFHIARYLDEKPAENIAFEAARDEILQHLYPEWRRQRFYELGLHLAKSHHVEVYAARLQGVAATPAATP